jgi:predicted phage tail protein
MEGKKVKVVSFWFSLVAILLLSSVILAGCAGESAEMTPVPTGVTVTPGDGQATIAWTAVPSATSYNIYWSTTAGVTPANGTQITGATSPYTITGLTDGTPYYFVVTAVNIPLNGGTGESAASSQVSCIPDPVPTGVAATPGDNQATIAWTAVTGATSYNVYWSTTTGVTPANGTQITSAANPYTLTGLTNGKTYYFVVTAVNGSGESAPSSQLSCTPGQPVPPGGAIANPGDGQATIAWTPVPAATSYNIYWSTTAGVTPANGIKIANATGPYNLTGLTNGTTYYVVVTAVNGYGESAASTQVSATPSATPPPAAPSGVTATLGDGQATIAWTIVPNADSYNIYWSTTAGVTPANGTQITSATNPYTLTGLTDGTTYYFVVTAVNGNGESAASLQASCTPALAVPTGITAAPGNGQATIAWTPVPGATSYNIYWSIYPGVTPANGYLKTNATSPYTLTGLTSGTTYYFVVTAVNNSGESAASTQASATPQ